MDSRAVASLVLLGVFLLLLVYTPDARATVLFLNMTPNTGVGGTNYRFLSPSSSGISNNSTLVVERPAGKYFWNPATASSTTGNPDSGIPAGFGWASGIDNNFTGTIPAGAWSFGTLTKANGTGTGTVIIAAYKTCNNVNTFLFNVRNATNVLAATTNQSLFTTFSAPSNVLSSTANNTCQIKVEYWLNVSTQASATTMYDSFEGGMSLANVSFPTPINVINSATLNAPASDPNINTGDTFTMTGMTDTDNSASGISMTFEYNFTGQASFIDIPTSAGGLTISVANPQANAQNNTAYSRTITGNTAGTYFVRVKVYNSTTSINSTVQKVTVNPDVPRWGNQSENTSSIVDGGAALLSASWSDLDGLSNAILETNETGAPQNKSGSYGSPLSLTGTFSWSNFTWQNASVPTGAVQWRIFANDSLNVFNVTPLMTFTVTQPTINSATLNAPASDPNILTGGTFAMTGTAITSNATSGINMSFEYNFTGQASFVSIPASGGGLDINIANPQVNILNNTAYSGTVTAGAEGAYFVRVRVYNSTTNMTSSVQKVTVSPTIPGWGNQSENASFISQGQAILLSASWSDLDSLSRGMLETNETGSPQNKSDSYGSPLSLSGTFSWTNFTWQNASVPKGSVVRWRIFANDSFNDFNVTPYMTFRVSQQLTTGVSQTLTLNTPGQKVSIFNRIGSVLFGLASGINSTLSPFFASTPVTVTPGGQVAPSISYVPVPPVAMAFVKSPVLAEALPGQTVPEDIVIANVAGVEIDNVRLSASGIPASWLSVSPGSLNLAANATGEFTVYIAVPETAVPGDHPVTITAAGNGVTDQTSFTLRVGTFSPESDKAITTRYVDINRTAGSVHVSLTVHNGYTIVPRMDVTEDIKKSIASSVNDITFIDKPDSVLQSDPVVMWTILDFPPNATRTFSYVVKGISSDLSNYVYWPLEELAISYSNVPSSVSVTPLKPLSVLAGADASVPVTLSNSGNETQTIVLGLSAPSGWEVTPINMTYELFPGETHTFRFLMYVPSPTVPGYYVGMVMIGVNGNIIAKEYQFAALGGLDYSALILPVSVVLAAVLGVLYFNAKRAKLISGRER